MNRKKNEEEGVRNIFGVVRKSTIAEEIGKKRGVSEKNPMKSNPYVIPIYKLYHIRVLSNFDHVSPSRNDPNTVVIVQSYNVLIHSVNNTNKMNRGSENQYIY